MKKSVWLLMVCVCGFLSKLSAQSYVSSFRAGSTQNDFGRSIVVDRHGYIYIAGFFRSTITLGTAPASVTLNSSGDYDVFLAKYRPCGNDLVWAVRIGGAGEDRSIYNKLQLAIDANANLYLAGSFEGTATFSARTSGSTTRNSAGNKDFFLVKYDSSGNISWLQTGGGASLDLGHSVDVDVNGNVYFTGTFSGSGVNFYTNPSGSGSSIVKNSTSTFEDIYVAKFNASGVLQWVATAGGGQADVSTDINADALGNVYVCGLYGYNSSTATFGSTTISNTHSWGAFVAKVNASGTWGWVRHAGSGTSDEYAWAVHEKNNIIYVAGYFDGVTTFTTRTGPPASMSATGYNAYIIKLDSSGQILKYLVDGASGNELIQDITLLNDGKIYLTGAFSGAFKLGNITLSSLGGYDAFVAIVDSSFAPTNTVYRVGGTGEDYGYDVAFDATGRQVYTGQFESSMNVGTNTLVSAGSTDMFCIKVNTPLVPPEQLIQGAPTICAGDSIRIFVSDSSAGYGFLWLLNGSPIAGATSHYYYAKQSGQYRVIRYSCSFADTSAAISISLNSIVANAGTDKTITAGDSVMLNGTGTASAQYRWFPSTTLSDTVGLTPFAKPPITTSYVLRVSQGNCVAYDTVVVYVTSATCNDCSAAYQVNDSLVACYLFNGDALDNSGNNNHGTVYGATLTTDRFGVANSAYAFDGVNDYIEVPYSSSLKTPLITLSAWVHPNNTNWTQIITKRNWNNAHNEQYALDTRSINFKIGVSCTSAGIGWTSLNYPNPLPANQWTFVVATYDGQNLRTYINGTLASTNSLGSFRILDTCTGANVRIGCNMARCTCVVQRQNR